MAVDDVPSETSQVDGTATFAVLPDIAYSEHDPDAIMITVAKGRARPTAGMKASQILTRAILCSVGAEAPAGDGFTSLPLMLVKGPSAAIRMLASWLEERFDCRVSPLEFHPYDLIWIATEWAAPDAEADLKTQRALELTYSPPVGVTGISKLTYSVEPATIRELRTRSAPLLASCACLAGGARRRASCTPTCSMRSPIP